MNNWYKDSNERIHDLNSGSLVSNFPSSYGNSASDMYYQQQAYVLRLEKEEDDRQLDIAMRKQTLENQERDNLKKKKLLLI